MSLVCKFISDFSEWENYLYAKGLLKIHFPVMSDWQMSGLQPYVTYPGLCKNFPGEKGSGVGKISEIWLEINKKQNVHLVTNPNPDSSEVESFHRGHRPKH